MLDLDELGRVQRIISHANCPDGIASAMILRDALPDARVELVQYGTKEHEALACTEGMLFCDMSPPPARAHEFVAAGAIVLDHHKSAADVVAAFGSRGIFADERSKPGVSGAVLAYRHVWQPRAAAGHSRWRACEIDLRTFALRAGVRDTWQTSDERWPEACAQAQALLFWGERLLHEREGREPWLLWDEQEVGRLLYERQLERAEAIARHGLELVGRFAFFNDTTCTLVSDVAEAMRRDPFSLQADVLVSYSVVTDHARSSLRYNYSLRALRDDVDVSLLAKRIHGGGHRGAAGGYVELGRGDGAVWYRSSPWLVFMQAVEEPAASDDPPLPDFEVP